MNIDEAALKAEPLAVLRELLESEEAQYPAAKQGQAAQTAWVERKYAAREAARALVQLGQPVGAATAERAKAFTTHELERLAKQAGMTTALFCGSGSCVWSEGCNGVKQGHLEAFARLCRAEDSAMRKDAMRWQYVKGIARHESSWRGRTWTFDLASNSANLDAATDAASAAVGRNREAGGS